ncbi:hypothetical protein ABTZ58_39575 [Streptomyces sp. NPDC094143]|uniref:hypothetical protein n=1 Tax=Streptomyces sp. NPDC094143 TaxID=3155310 RepID=UPI0033213F29
MTMQAATDAAIAQARTWRRTGIWNVTHTDYAMAAELLTSLPWPTASAAEAAHAPLGTRLDHLRECLAALAVATATSRTPMGWFLGQCASVLAPVLQWQPDGTPDHATITPTPEEITGAEHALTAIRNMLTTIQPH